MGLATVNQIFHSVNGVFRQRVYGVSQTAHKITVQRSPALTLCSCPILRKNPADSLDTMHGAMQAIEESRVDFDGSAGKVKIRHDGIL
ncbi:hypothetical protein A9O66_14450 [Paraburkholderia caribensis]|uniref:Uncharacterized protein n=1 Tax=Paraburkholderia caribensis TaxID=75105 RepID=A0A9Q6S281_9BURK|nr:hypothetical protein A9O66_14450 [Paraburkholderia caribensis]